MDWLNLFAVQGTLKSLLQHHSSKASVLWCSAFFILQLSHPYMITGKTIALTRLTFVGLVMSLRLNTLSRLVITFLPRSKRLLISWLLMGDNKTWKKVKEENEKAGLKLNTQKSKIMASSPIMSWQIDGKTMKTVREFILESSKNYCRWWLQPWN